MTKEQATVIAKAIMTEVIEQCIGQFDEEETGYFIDDFVRIIMRESA